MLRSGSRKHATDSGTLSETTKSSRRRRRNANAPSTKPANVAPPQTPEEEALALPKGISDPDVLKFLEKQYAGNISTSDKNLMFSALARTTALGKRDLTKMWKGIETLASKGKSTDLSDSKFFPVVNQWDFDKLVEYAQRRLADENEKDPFLFHFSGELARLTTSEDGTIRIETMNQNQFEHELNRVSKWSHATVSGDSETERGVACPTDVARHIFNGPRSDFLPLNRLVAVPTFTKQKMITTPGYKDGIYYMPQKGLSLPTLELAPSEDRVRQAIYDLADLFADIPLDGMSRKEFMNAIDNGQDVSSFSHLLSYGLSSVVRELIDGPVAGHLARKDKPRSGATLALTIMERVATCQPSAPQSLPVREEEVQKTIMSIFREGASYVLFDNIKGGAEIESDALAAAMTAYPTYKGRILGASTMATVPANAVFGFTGNRSALSPQLAERMLLIDIDPKMESPGTRAPSSFKCDLTSEVQKNAGHYLGCLLTLVHNWIAKGCPEWTGTPLGGFERHAAVVGGVLEAAGVFGFMKNRDKLNALVKTDDPISDFMDALIAENQETGSQFDGTLFKVGSTDSDLPISLRNNRVLSFSDILNQAQIALPNFGYKTAADGEVFYPASANSRIAQRIKNLEGTVRNGEGETAGRWILQEHPESTKKSGKLYYLRHLDDLAA
ncbi:hypothetical protein DS901_06475 [Loktanella sp. D2R18]|uniref:hypothetical protein n=1 Tax=Rhodobacterales TaxID=204455 RepID=UPI000DE8EB2B|nr:MULTISPECIES: hypothetical protein [Rhodobacterales]MDO6591837.1 hypothetical protein [Yoonia sp. 1_MG-2023]RBW44864.1 hypothetical protein DS901_06475 [Loktanella sp. D2R18]